MANFFDQFDTADNGQLRITVRPPGVADPPSLAPSHRDLAIRTIYGEAANEPDEGQAAVAAVIRNRVAAGRYGGRDIPGVVLAKNLCEPWNNTEARARMSMLKPDDPRYQKIGSIVDQVFGGQMPDPTNGSTHFFSPTAQAALGRQVPVWAQGEGQPIGRHTFYAPEGRVGATDVSAQSRQTAPKEGNFFDQFDEPAAQGLPDTGGRFTDTAGQNFRTAREGQSPIAPFMANPDVSTRHQTWPERLVRGVGSSIASGATLPGDTWSGQAQIPSSGAVPGSVPFGDPGSSGHRVADLAGLAGGVSPVARMGGGWATGVPRTAPPVPPALEANLAAQNIGVELPRAIGTDSTITKFMGQVANKMPGGGPMQERVGNAIRQTGDAVAAASEKAGGAVDPMAAGQGFKAGIETSFKPTIKKRIGEAYNEVEKHIDLSATRPLVATQKVVDDIVARRAASGEADPGKAVKTVLGGVGREGPTQTKTVISGDGYHIADEVATRGGLTYGGVKDLRTRVGEMLDTGVFPEGMSQGELRRLYSSLSDDLKATVAATGGDKALSAFNRANAMNKFAEEWKDNLGKVLGSDRSGEGINAALLRMASSGATGDIKALTMARAAVPREAWQDVASTAISRLGLDRKGDFNPAMFLNDFAKLSDRGKTLLFRDVGSGDVLPHLNNIAAVSKKFVEAGKLANTSGTAGHGAAMTAMGGAGLGFITGSFVEPLTAISVVVGNNLMARALSKPASAATVARWSRSYEALVSKPGPQSFAGFNIASRNLANTVNSELGLRVQPGDFMKAIQAPATGRAEDEQPGVPRPPGQ